MPFIPNTEDWNLCILMLIQALLGSLSSNVRAVKLKYVNNSWVVNVFLEKDSEEDENEFMEVADEMSIFMEDIKYKISKYAYTDVKLLLNVTQKCISIEDDGLVRTVFKRKE